MGRGKRYILDLTQAITEITTLSFELDQAFWTRVEGPEIPEGDVKAEVTIEPMRGLYELTFVFRGHVVVPCDRCLSPVTLPVDCTSEMTFEMGDEFVDDGDDVIILNANDPVYDLSWLMYEMVALSLPIQRVHPIEECDPQMVKYILGDEPESDSTGNAGSRAVDPRWEALKEAMKKSNNN